MSLPRAVLLSLFAALLMSEAAGCSGSSPSTAKSDGGSAVPRLPPPPVRKFEAADDPTPEPPAVQQQPQERYPIGPWMEWSIANSEKIPGKSYLKLVVNAGRASVLQLTNYDVPAHEEFPSIAMLAQTSAASFNELLNRKLVANLYIAVEKDGNLLRNLPTQPVEITITEIAGKNIRGSFVGECHDEATGGNGSIAGKFQAVMESELQ